MLTTDVARNRMSQNSTSQVTVTIFAFLVKSYALEPFTESHCIVRSDIRP